MLERLKRIFHDQQESARVIEKLLAQSNLRERITLGSLGHSDIPRFAFIPKLTLGMLHAITSDNYEHFRPELNQDISVCTQHELIAKNPSEEIRYSDGSSEYITRCSSHYIRDEGDTGQVFIQSLLLHNNGRVRTRLTYLLMLPEFPQEPTMEHPSAEELKFLLRKRGWDPSLRVRNLKFVSTPPEHWSFECRIPQKDGHDEVFFFSTIPVNGRLPDDHRVFFQCVKLSTPSEVQGKAIPVLPLFRPSTLSRA